jgi:hypothetical protein
VQVQPGQRRSGQAGSECCHSLGDWRVRSVHSEQAGREDQLRNRHIVAKADVVNLAEGSIRSTDTRGRQESPESPARGMLAKGFPVNPGELDTAPDAGLGYAQPKGTRSRGARGVPCGKRTSPRRRETCHQGKPEATANGARAVLRVHSTDEDGEPQGSRKGRPRHPSEGRDEQIDVSTQRHRPETQNSRRPVTWN